MTPTTKLQITLNQFFNCNLAVDGISGPKTEQAKKKVADYFALDAFPECGLFLDFLHQSSVFNLSEGLDMVSISSFKGKRLPERISTFGGPDDKGDRTNGLAFVDTFQATTPRSIAETWIARDYPLNRLFRVREMMDAAEWPVIAGDTMGLSYYLDTRQDYAAMRLPSGAVKKALRAGCLTVCVYCVKSGYWIDDVPVIDYGPAEWTGRAIDVSPAVLELIRAQTDDIVAVSWCRG